MKDPHWNKNSNEDFLSFQNLSKTSYIKFIKFVNANLVIIKIVLWQINCHIAVSFI